MSSGNSQLEAYIKKLVEREVTKAIADLRSEVSTQREKISVLEDKVRRANSTLNDRVDATEAALSAETEKNNMQLVAIEETVNNQVAKTIQETIEPRLQQMHKYFDEKTLDGTDMVTQWRKKVYASNRDVKKITSGDAKRDFQSNMFAFTDDD